jgi:hypothetical protein
VTIDGASNGKKAMSMIKKPKRICGGHQAQRSVKYAIGDSGKAARGRAPGRSGCDRGAFSTARTKEPLPWSRSSAATTFMNA